jgi:CheY-like chemotaxis protein
MAGTGCILVVDDEETVRTVTKRTLKRFGYTVVLAEDGREAVEIFKEQPNRFELILLDMAMPHMNGEEAYREIRRINKKARVILCSGYSEREATSRFAGKGLVGFLQKPYGPKVLISKVNEVLKKSKK